VNHIFRIIFLGALAALLTSAAANPGAVLVFDDDDSQLIISDASGHNIPPYEGLVVGPGATVQTRQTTAEFRLSPNGSLLKLAKNTIFRIQALKDSGDSTNSFRLDIGRVRVVAAKLVGASSYDIKTPIAQAGVRGTDFVLEANAAIGDWICVKEGAVEFARDQAPAGQAKSILVKTGEFANAAAAKFEAKKATADDIAARFAGLDFKGAKETDVPGHQKK
jgi:hypothetical protein